MAPIKKIKTYNRSNRSLVNNSVDAGKVLFHHINKPKARKKRRLLIKELPPRAHGETLLGQDSFHVSTEDTFDKLMKGDNYNPVNIKSHISLVNNTDRNVSNSIKRINKFYSPIMTRRRNKIASVIEISSSTNISNKEDTSPVHNSSESVKSVNYLFSPIMTRSKNKSSATDTCSSTVDNNKKALTDDVSDVILQRFKEPTVDRVDFSLEVEKVRKQAPNSLSYIIIPEIKHAEMSINALQDNRSENNLNTSFEPIFTKTFREKQLIHSSTPLAPLRSKKIVNYTISPIKNVSSIENHTNSELGQSNFIMPNISSTPLKLLMCPNAENIPKDDLKVTGDFNVISVCPQIEDHKSDNNYKGFKSIEKIESQVAEQQFQKIIGVTQSPLLPERRRGNVSRESFITLRRRKVLKNNFFQANRSTKKQKDKTLSVSKNINKTNSISLVPNKKTNQENGSIMKNTCNLKDFELFEVQNKYLLTDSNKEDMSIKYINRRRRRATDSFLTIRKKQKIDDSDSNQCKSLKRLSLQEDSVTQYPEVTMKDIIVLLPQISVPNGSSAGSLSGDLSNFSIHNKNQQSLTNSSTSTDSYEIPENDFFRLKNPVFRRLVVDITRQAYDQHDSSLDMCRSKGSLETLHNESESLFEECAIPNGNKNYQNFDDTEKDNCSIINQNEILNLIKKSIGSSISSPKNKIASIVVNKENNDNYVRQDNRHSESAVRDSRESSEHVQVSAENFEEFFRNVTKRSRSVKRSESEVKCGTSERFSSDSIDDRQLIVNLTRSPRHRNERQSISPKNDSQDVIVDLTDSFDLGSRKSVVSNNEEIEQFRKHSISDIIESSVLESSKVDGDGFKIPSMNNPKRRQSKTLVLKAGKLWRRSLSMYKKSSILLSAMNEDACVLSNGNFCTCPKCNIARQSVRLSHRRLSIRIVPAGVSGESRREISVLENYAHNASYVSDRILEDNLENDLRSLSLSKKKLSIVQNSAPVTARDLVLKRCGQEEPLPFEECYPKSVLQNCQKIGEGVYGEVFLFRNPNGGTSVMKVIPIEGDLIVNGERQKKFEEILSEITIALELSNLRNNKENTTSGFAEVQKVHCVQGCYPEKLLDLWELYDETRGSENDSPEIFGEDQLYIVLQLANAGTDLEAFIFNNALQAYTMFQQVACALAVAEEELRFEHRDLHWGNVLLSTVDKNSKVAYRLDGKNYDIMTKGVEVSIIDFTLSRIECDGVVIFNDLGLDPELFTAEGDYQFEIYKLMQKKNGNNWQRFEPYSNVLWLHYTLDKAITALRYKSTQSKVHKEYLGKLRQLKGEILNYNSVKEFVTLNF